MHGAGNDYVYVDLISQPDLQDHPAIRQPGQLAIDVSARRTGIGSDGLVLIYPTEDDAAARMRMFNADGSEAEMCGNALRCVAYLLIHRHGESQSFSIQTGRGPLSVFEGDGSICVEMGRPVLDARSIPTTLAGDPPVDTLLKLGELKLSVSCVSMGNPHCVVFDNDLTDDLVVGCGPQIEHAACFPSRTNVEFAQLIDRSNIKVRVWERGSGETAACGTGACAVVVAGVLSGRCDRTVNVALPGGTLCVDWRSDDNVYLSGPVAEVFSGEWSLKI
ncbi:UNVERIFIED_CONTAM: hypothetical protein GTU68_052649 [Idotea baltica]|nr:hypothetical protein [Idotea baltica]